MTPVDDVSNMSIESSLASQNVERGLASGGASTPGVLCPTCRGVGVIPAAESASADEMREALKVIYDNLDPDHFPCEKDGNGCMECFLLRQDLPALIDISGDETETCVCDPATNVKCGYHAGLETEPDAPTDETSADHRCACGETEFLNLDTQEQRLAAREGVVRDQVVHRLIAPCFRIDDGSDHQATGGNSNLPTESQGT